MPAKVTIAQHDPSNIKEVHRIIPDNCPNCGANLTKEGSIVEGAYVWTTRQASINNNDQLLDLTDIEIHDTSIVTSHMCNACDHLLSTPQKTSRRTARK